MTNSLKAWPIVQQGIQAQAVRDGQHLLREQGIDLAVDGVFGPMTDAAVREFQRKNDLAVDGIVGPNTWGALIVHVSRGSHGDAVRAVQEELKIRAPVGNPEFDIEVDGVFGPKTDAAVRVFQAGVARAAENFPIDGIVGPLTWQALIGGMLAD